MAASTFIDLCRFVTGTLGTGTTITVGSAVQGFLTPTQAGAADQQTFSYAVYDPGNANPWEKGTALFTLSGATFVRTVTASANSNTPISLSASAIFIFTALGSDIVNTQGPYAALAAKNFGAL